MILKIWLKRNGTVITLNEGEALPFPGKSYSIIETDKNGINQWEKYSKELTDLSAEYDDYIDALDRRGELAIDNEGELINLKQEAEK